MPIVRLRVYDPSRPLSVVPPPGGRLVIPRPQFRCVVRLPNIAGAVDAIVDTGAPFTLLLELIWNQFREGIDFEWLPFAAEVQPPPGRVAGWQFTFRMARFLVPILLADYSAQVSRPGVVAQFALGNPPSVQSRLSLPPIILGLWGGVLEGGRVAIDRDPATGSVAGAVEFP